MTDKTVFLIFAHDYNHELNDIDEIYKARIRAAIAIAKKRKKKEDAFFIVTATSFKEAKLALNELAARYLLKLKAPKEKIVREKKAHNTYEEISNAIPLINSIQPSKVYFVSSKWHIPRIAILLKTLDVNYTEIAFVMTRNNSKEEHKMQIEETQKIALFIKNGVITIKKNSYKPPSCIEKLVKYMEGENLQEVKHFIQKMLERKVKFIKPPNTVRN